MKVKQIIFIFLSALVLVGTVMGALVFGLVWYSDYTGETSDAEGATLECPEGQNSYMCVIKGYLRPKESEGIE